MTPDEVKERARKAPKTFRVIIRHLPPNMTSSELLKQMQPPDYVDFYLESADESWRPYNFKRAYFDFLAFESACQVFQQFDGYTFVDELGDEGVALVEWAPNQKGTMRSINKVKQEDTKYCSTILEDSYYKKYIEETEAADKAEETGATAVGVDKLMNDLEKKKNQKHANAKALDTVLLAYIDETHGERLRLKAERFKNLRQAKEAKKAEQKQPKRNKDKEARLARRKKREEEKKKDSAYKSKKDRDVRLTASKTDKQPQADKFESDPHLLSHKKEVKQRMPHFPPDGAATKKEQGAKSEKRDRKPKEDKPANSEATSKPRRDDKEHHKRPEREVYQPRLRHNRQNKNSEPKPPVNA